RETTKRLHPNDMHWTSAGQARYTGEQAARDSSQGVDARRAPPYCLSPNDMGGPVTDHDQVAQDVQDVIASLREQGIDVIRVSYADMIGVDRGRDVLLEELPTVVGHGLAFCRAVYHRSEE